MKTLRWIASKTLIGSGALMLGTVLNWAPSSFAQAPATRILIGQCRAVNKRTPIYTNRDPFSEVVVLLERDSATILAENGSISGMIAVSKPQPGFVSTVNLKQCSGQSTPPKVTTTPQAPTPPKAPTTPKTSVCRQVVQPQGLIVRSAPASAATIVGSFAANQKITLVEPLETRKLDDGRVWVRTATPIKGWVSEGFVNEQFRNLAPCN